jgi:hypothetical protein
MKYVIYRPSGEISRVVECDDPDEQLGDGERWIRGNADDVTQWVKNGQLEHRGPPPSSFHVFDHRTEQWVDPRSKSDIDKHAAMTVRVERDKRLLASDWTDTSTAPTRLGEQLYSAWQSYRQSLRDIPKQATFPHNVNWPTPPQL